ncbi:hypothetical protein DFP72DRAFT_321719 [Ephemerocybe angulata]|uniref:Histone H1 n=1 Tax=Ephemerocybe angulata TaxID=980116 RepID=A0A8H6MFX0_9AGAR|nr:hypothetical protein DFP72DRAFT_321719 [Tulosesus angulatus]
MQVAGSAYPASQPLYPYPNHYHHHHHPIPVAHDHELKRQYLTLLPPQQIIEICLNFDVHVPPYVKASIWPIDLSSAIAGLRKQAAEKPSQDAEGQAKNSSSSTGDEDIGGGAIMDSLTQSPSLEPSPAPESEQSKASIEEPRPPDKEAATEDQETSTPQPDAPESSSISVASSTSSTSSAADAPTTTTEEESPSTSSSSSASTSTPTPSTTTPAAESASHQPQPPPAAPTPAAPPPAQPVPVAYPHQPYGYPYAPYYPPPPPGYPYPHHQYPAYPHQQPHAHAYPPPPPPAALPPVPPPPAQPMPMMQDGQSPDDLPSYEEMIVEALMDTNDPEGCAPKDLFTWMAARYPVQSNFRPSASQALQKAYKRGRLEKSSNNKYRLNAAWEGGNTSRRTTRRPQTHTHTITSSNNAAPSSPFTNAPLVHHHQQPQQQQHHQQTYAYSTYPYPQSAYSSFSQQQQTTAASTTATTTASTSTQQPVAPAAASTSTATASTSEPKSADVQDKEVNDAYEAAQSILKAINFGSLLQLPADETQEGVAARGTDHTVPVQPYQQPQPNAVAGSSGTSISVAIGAASISAAQTAQHQPHTLLAALNGAQLSAATGAGQVPGGVAGSAAGVSQSSRADLQAQLALLAAQLTELVRVDDGATTAPSGLPVPPVVRPMEVQTQQPQQPQHQGMYYQPQPPAVSQPTLSQHVSPYAPQGAPIQLPHQMQPHQTQAQPQSQPQAQAPAPASIVDNSAPMAGLYPPSPPPQTQLPVHPTQLQPQPQPQDGHQQQPHQPQLHQFQPSQAQQHAEISQFHMNGTVGHQHHQFNAAQSTTNAVTTTGGEQSMPEQASSPALEEMEPMDDSLDGEYSEDDEDMEEVI